MNTKPLRLRWATAALALIGASLLLAVPNAWAEEPTVKRALKHDMSLPLRYLAGTANSQAVGFSSLAATSLTPGSASSISQALESKASLAGSGALPPLLLNFPGVDFSQFPQGGGASDDNGDVGPHHYVQQVNTSVAVYDKTGKLLLGPFPTNTLWAGFGGVCETTNKGDGIVQYDPLADRWIISQFAFVQAGRDYWWDFHECVAVSTTGDPLGSYYRYAFPIGKYDKSLSPDYPKLGVWTDGYYVTYNPDKAGNEAKAEDTIELSAIGSTSTKQEYPLFLVCALDRTKMLIGAEATQQCFNRTGRSYLPSDLDGQIPPPAGSPNYIVGQQPVPAMASQTPPLDHMVMYRFKVNWSKPKKTLLEGPLDLPVNQYVPGCMGAAVFSCIRQPQQAPSLNSMGLGTMYRLAYRNLGDHESLVASHTIAMDNAPASKSQTGIRWYEIRSPNATIPQVYQEGTAASETAGQYRWLGSIAMDRLGNIALGYNSSSTTLYPSINYIGRFATDPLGTMPYPEGLIMAGSGSQLGPNFGDYSAMQVDPEDECTFWYTGTYYKETSKNHWSTQIATFRFPDCEPPPIPEQATCGSANAHASVMSPTSGLCTVGIPGEVTTTAGDHHWTCSTGSGTPVQCTAPGGQIPGGSTRVTFEAPGCTTQSAGLNTAPKQKPGGIRMPYQMLYFQASQCPDKQANLRITYSDSVEELALWKTLTPNANNPSWVFVPEAKFSGNTLEVAIADNGPYDLDTRVGFIEDPIAPGTSNGKLAQPPLDFTINYSGVVCGMNVELLTTGGKGGGGIRYMVSRTGGTQCKIARNGGKGLLSTQGSLSDGSCTVRAIKGGDGRYNPTSSTAITIPVTCPSDLKK